MPYVPPTDDASLGRVALRVDRQIFDARIDPRARGIVIDRSATAASHVHRFGRDSTVAVADSVRIGSVILQNAPLVVSSVGGATNAIVGLDVLQRFAATFDPKQRQIVLRASGTVPAQLPGVRVPTLTTADDVRVLQGSAWVSLTAPTVAALLRTHRWTFDAKRGAIVLDR
jgi:hypothetical protein